MEDKKVIELLERHMCRELVMHGSRLPFYITDLTKIKQFNRPYFNVFEAGNFKIVLDSDGGCQYIEYKDKKYYDFKELRSIV